MFGIPALSFAFGGAPATTAPAVATPPNWEVANNNFAGMRIPGVHAGPNSGGFQAFNTPQAGIAAIAHQLDRYASGATTGKPLTTLGQIVSTWAPPSENPTPALIKRASDLTGFSPDQALDVSDPAVKAKLITALIANEQGGKLPSNLTPELISSAVSGGGQNNVSAAPPNPMVVAQAKNMGILPQSDAPTAPGSQLASAPPSLTSAQQTPDQLRAILAASSKGQGYGFNPSATLAQMAAGFLGGNGPAASLAGGFAGLAKGQNQGATFQAALAKAALTGNSDNAKTFSALVNAGVSPSVAATMSGLKFPAGTMDLADTNSNVHGDAYLKTLPSATAAQVKALSEGRLSFPTGYAISKQYWKNMLRSVAQYDPNFDAVNYNARSKTRNDFTSGKSAQAITSFNTAIGHLGSLLKSADALNNNRFPWLNQAANFAENNTGDPRVGNFNTDKQAVADELTRAFRMAGGTAEDIAGWEKNLNAANSPAQLHGAIQHAVSLLSSRIGAIGQQYSRGMGTTTSGISLLSPQARQTLQALPGGADLIAEAGGGQGTVAPSPAPTTPIGTAGAAAIGETRTIPGGLTVRRIQ